MNARMNEVLSSVRAVLFDVDGTIFSSEEIIPDTYQNEFKKFREETGRPEHLPDFPQIMEQIGKPVVEIFRNLAPDLSQTEQDSLSARILTGLVEDIEKGQGIHYPGVFQTLQELKKRGYQIFAASNGRRPYIESILKAARISPFFTEVPCLDNVRIKNKIELVSDILKRYNFSGEEALMVGDRFSDREAAEKNKCRFAACRYGHGNEEELSGAHVYLEKIDDLLTVLPVSIARDGK